MVEKGFIHFRKGGELKEREGKGREETQKKRKEIRG